MANRFPLIVDSTTSQIKELPVNDNIDLSNSGIVNATTVECGIVTTTTVYATTVECGIVTTTTVYATGDITTASDIKLKTNIKEISHPLDKVLKMRGVEYDRIDINHKHQIGVIAQEVEEVIPELISEIGDTKTVSYGNITAVLIEAIKEQQKEINCLKEKIQNLDNKLNNK